MQYIITIIYLFTISQNFANELSMLTQTDEDAYYFPGSEQDYTRANELCSAANYTLISIDNQKIQLFLEQFMRKNDIAEMWTAGEVHKSGTAMWTNTQEEIKNYTNWYPGYPEKYTETSFIHLSETSDYKWRNFPVTMYKESTVGCFQKISKLDKAFNGNVTNVTVSV